MSKQLIINSEPFVVNDNEYEKEYIEEFCNLNIYKNLGYHERIVSLINELSTLFTSFKTVFFYNITHGGYIPIKCADFYDKIYVKNESNNQHHIKTIKKNTNYYNLKNISIEKSYIKSDITIILDNIEEDILFDSKIVICHSKYLNKVDKPNYKLYYLSNTDLILFIHNEILNKFFEEFKYYIQSENYLHYDNLIHLAMIIKNGGDSLEHILRENLNIIDRWTILDTGSTDNTIDIIKKVLVGKKKGTLHQEPFINFRESRNRCLDLAGKKCKFIVTLDDTYIVKGPFRNFLNTIRGDQYSDSLSFYIQSDDVQYVSNRIIKSETNSRYIYTIHEVISPKNNTNVMVPIYLSYIHDFRSDYMQNRTMDRKKLDLKLLYDTIKEYPEDSRAYYYLGQTYNLLEEYELAYKNFIERMNHKDSGFYQEKIDAMFEAARIANFKLNKPWKECEELYFKAYNMDKSRPDSLYFIAIHYYLEARNGIDEYDNYKKAYDLFIVGFNLGYPLHSQYSLKPTLSYYFLPKFLTELCYMFNDYITGEKASDLFIDTITNKINDRIYKDIYNKTDENIVRSWSSIYKLLNIIPYQNLKNKVTENTLDKPYLCFLVDGGFQKWSGKDIKIKGIGGSETFIIEISKYVQKSGYYNVIVFCNCENSEIYEGVKYSPLIEFFNFIQVNHVDTCIVSRYTEYVPVCLNCDNIKNVYISLHDLVPDNSIIMPRNEKLKKIFCLSEWHTKYFTDMFPTLEDITKSFNYGIDIDMFDYNKKNIKKIPYKFIYSSFPTRGLLPLLQMWPKIVQKYPEATLHIHIDINNKWSNDTSPEIMAEIKNILSVKNKTIIYHGWTSKEELANNWMSSDIWFYPCTFLETFCLTALEAALSKTFVITRNFGSLPETVGERGVFLESTSLYDPYTTEWQSKALVELFNVLENKSLKEQLVGENYKWAKNMSWESRANMFIRELDPSYNPGDNLGNNLGDNPGDNPGDNLGNNLGDNPGDNLYIIKNVENRLNYAEMYNWTNDIPPNRGAYEQYIRILDYIKWKNTNKEINVLEIGTFTGTSIIKILEYLPNSRGSVIDLWEDYNEKITKINGNMEDNKNVNNIKNNNIENIFYNNIKIAGLNNIKVFKGESANILLDMISENKHRFDYIYLDSSHKLMDSYTDLVLSFNLLNKGGVIGIDDYLLNKQSLFDSPFFGVNYFLERFKDKIILLDKQYRVFIEKI
jgi:hypothetical protein